MSTAIAIAITTVAVAAVLVTLNLLTLRRLWASPLFETSQKLAQSVLLWVVPGSVFVVRHLLADARSTRSDDPTAVNPAYSHADSTFIDHGGHHNV